MTHCSEKHHATQSPRFRHPTAPSTPLAVRKCTRSRHPFAKKLQAQQVRLRGHRVRCLENGEWRTQGSSRWSYSRCAELSAGGLMLLHGGCGCGYGHGRLCPLYRTGVGGSPTDCDLACHTQNVQCCRTDACAQDEHQ